MKICFFCKIKNRKLLNTVEFPEKDRSGPNYSHKLFRDRLERRYYFYLVVDICTLSGPCWEDQREKNIYNRDV